MKVRRGDLKARGNDLSGTLKALSKLSDDVENAIPGGDDNTVDSSDPKLADAIKALREGMSDVDQKWQALVATSGAGSAGGGGADVVVTDQERLGFSQFLSNIGTAMLDTQRELDAQSLTYLQENSQNRHVLPSIFRLPKLSAEMKFALEKQDEKTVNLVFFKNQTMAKEMHQQSIKFDLVSAPPPPDAMAAIQTPVPEVSLVLRAAERKQVLDAGFAAKGDNTLPADADPDRVVILGVEPQLGYIVMYAAKAGKNNVGVWLFSKDTFRGIYKFDQENDDAERFLRKFVSDLAAEQQSLLAKT